MTPNHLLAIYYSSRYDWPITAPLGRDPAVERTAGNDAGRLLRLVADVGACLAFIPERSSRAIAWRWTLVFLAGDYDGDARILRNRARLLERWRRPADARRCVQLARVAERDAAGIRNARRKFEKRKIYQDAMDQFRAEVIARNLFAEAVTGRKKFRIGS